MNKDTCCYASRSESHLLNPNGGRKELSQVSVLWPSHAQHDMHVPPCIYSLSFSSPNPPADTHTKEPVYSDGFWGPVFFRDGLWWVALTLVYGSMLTSVWNMLMRLSACSNKWAKSKWEKKKKSRMEKNMKLVGRSVCVWGGHSNVAFHMYMCVGYSTCVCVWCIPHVYVCGAFHMCMCVGRSTCVCGHSTCVCVGDIPCVCVSLHVCGCVWAFHMCVGVCGHSPEEGVVRTESKDGVVWGEFWVPVRKQDKVLWPQFLHKYGIVLGGVSVPSQVWQTGVSSRQIIRHTG